MATKEAYAVDGGWAYRWMLTSERSIIPAYVVLVTLIVCMLIAIAVVNTLPSVIEEGTTSIAGVPFLTRPRVRVADAAVLTTIDNTSYTTDNY
ncbi:hypothetical protein HPB50_018028 [Hyalomma asiaticum]|uniref:Uncharacterized protein n=1 Tax=Hyalomma asiaticum TaxID=266040 RepID=A0ACB7S784_HYAAI|nr:hypothetical protein HPB50_018028 [Hyalomma asiaticum]